MFGRHGMTASEKKFAATVLLAWTASVTVACAVPASAPTGSATRLFYDDAEPISSTQSPRRQGQLLVGRARPGMPTGRIEVKLRAAAPRSVQAVDAKTSDDVSYFEVYLATEGSESEEDMFSATVSSDSDSFTIKDVEAGSTTLYVGAFDEDGNNITKDDWVKETIDVSEGGTAEVSLQVDLEDGSTADGGKIKASVTVKDGKTTGKLAPSLETE